MIGFFIFIPQNLFRKIPNKNFKFFINNLSPAISLQRLIAIHIGQQFPKREHPMNLPILTGKQIIYSLRLKKNSTTLFLVHLKLIFSFVFDIYNEYIKLIFSFFLT